MKNYFVLAVACFALLLCSCQKEDLRSEMSTNSGKNIDAAAASQETLPIQGASKVQYGALINAPGAKGSLDFQVNVAGQLGISCIRTRVIVSNPGSVPLLNTGYKVVLNFNSDFKGTALPFISDLRQYRQDLQNILSGFSVKPVVAVIENEESNAYYHTGTAEDYIKQLSVAIDVMHANGIKVANGGITDVGLCYLVYQDFINQGKYDSAELFRKAEHVTPNRPATKDRGAFVNALLQAYAQMDLDYVNFHWKGESPDTQALAAVIAYLKKATGKPIISNELGQFDTDPNTLTTHVQKCAEEGFPYIIWYSPDENAGQKDLPLQHSDASLTPSGVAYQHFPKN